jgi:hypothetical protein
MPVLHRAREASAHRDDRARRRHHPHAPEPGRRDPGRRCSGATAIKAALNDLVPFVVANLGMLSGRGGAQGNDRAPREP